MDRYATTIVVADLAGYSRLMAADEAGVFDRLRSLRMDVVTPLVGACDGRIVKTMGDGILIEFPSPAVAVEQTISIQQTIARREASFPESDRFRFRVGINYGEVMRDGDDLIGDVVNVAARLEGLAPPGGICVSRQVHDEIVDKIDCQAHAMGARRVKNIPEAVEVWRLDFSGMDAIFPTETLTAPPLAVLPFRNISGSSEQDFLANGIVEDVLTELSRFRYLNVISSSSTFGLRNSKQDLLELSERLGARYIVEGSVAQANERVRLTARLIDTTSGVQIWGDKFDRAATEIFDLQDDLTAAVVAGVSPNVGAHERYLARRKPTANLTAWELCQRALGEFYAYTPAAHEKARGYLALAIEEDPQFSLPHSYLARLLSFQVNSGITDNPRRDITDGLAAAAQAIALDDRNELAFATQAILCAMAGRLDDAYAALKHAELLNPNSADVHLAAYSLELFAHNPNPEAIARAVSRLGELSPNDPAKWAHEISLGYAYLIEDGGMTQRFAEIAEAATRHPNTPAFPHMFAAAGRLKFQNDATLARNHLEGALMRRPDLTASDFPMMFQFPTWRAVYASIENDLARLTSIGLPEN